MFGTFCHSLLCDTLRTCAQSLPIWLCVISITLSRKQRNGQLTRRLQAHQDDHPACFFFTLFSCPGSILQALSVAIHLLHFQAEEALRICIGIRHSEHQAENDGNHDPVYCGAAGCSPAHQVTLEPSTAGAH